MPIYLVQALYAGYNSEFESFTEAAQVVAKEGWSSSWEEALGLAHKEARRLIISVVLDALIEARKSDEWSDSIVEIREVE